MTMSFQLIPTSLHKSYLTILHQAYTKVHGEPTTLPKLQSKHLLHLDLVLYVVGPYHACRSSVPVQLMIGYA